MNLSGCKWILFLAIVVTATSCRPGEAISPGNSNNNSRPAIIGGDQTQKNLPAANDPARIIGTVVHISDGDTFIIETADGERTTVRIHAIDAPELAQSFGKESRENLRALMANQEVFVRKQKKDQFNRVVGDVFFGDKDIGLEQVKGGYAWHFKQYQKEQSPNDRKLYTDAETAARNSRLGLWREDNPAAPLDYRRGHQSGHERRK